MNCEILSVGTELLMGQITNTNAQFISEKLNELGVDVYYHSVVGDNPQRIKEAFSLALKRVDIVITTGGTGPTQDDITKEIVSEELGEELFFDENSFRRIQEYFEENKKIMTPNNEKQAYMPRNCKILYNRIGTAPGCIIEKNNKIVIILPGPPSELNPMFEELVVPFLLRKVNKYIKSIFVKVFGIGEAQVEQKLLHLIKKQTQPTIATYCSGGEVLVRLTASGESEKDLDIILSNKLEEIHNCIGEYIYSVQGESLPQTVVRLLNEYNKTIAFAESCTGGMVSAKITDIPGVSSVFNRGIVSYSNQSKIENLGISTDIIDKFGAVSEKTARLMAKNIRNIAKTDIGVSITGIAGPSGRTSEKPVGLVYIGLADNEGSVVKELRLSGNRGKIRNTTCLYVFDMIRRRLKGLNLRG